MTITGSVGEGGVNHKEDVIAVQKLLSAAGRYPEPADGTCDAALIQAIRDFQAGFASHPDGRVDPDGATLRRLNAAAAPASEWSGDSAQ